MSTENTNLAAEPKKATVSRPTLPPLFRKIDWLTFGLAFAAVWIVYYVTLAPELTLEDSGELCTGSFYAGIPHPPGYPVWTIYTWLWTVLVPFKNVAWRVALGEATASAFACGLVGLMVSRGSSMFMEGIEDLKSMTGKWENAICLSCGFTAGVLLGLGGVMWSESVAINRISLFGVPWMTTLMLCMMRWIYAPHQRRYLFLAMFFFGICLTIHQTLLVAAMGIEAAVASCQPRLGRTLFLGNSIIYITGLIAYSLHLTTSLDTGTIRDIFHFVGISSIAVYALLAWLTKETAPEFGLDASMAALVVGCVIGVMGHGVFYYFLAFVGAVGFGIMAARTWNLGHEWLAALTCAVLWFMGALFYLYEAISGMTNPPMEWGYPRTVEGFWHAFTRGQYDKVNPTDVFGDPGRFLTQLGMLIGDVAREYNWILVLVALVPLFFFRKLKKRERTWLICLTGTYLCISVFLIILMNPSNDRASAELHRVFFASSHAMIAILIGYGLALMAAYMATHYERVRRWGFIGGGIAAFLALCCLLDVTGFFSGIAGFSGVTSDNSNGLVKFVATCSTCVIGLTSWCAHAFGRLFDFSRYGTFFHVIFQSFEKDRYGLPILAGLILLALPLVLLGALYAYRKSAPLAILLALFVVIPLTSGLSHWFSSEQRHHWFGYWYGHDMFTPPFTAPDGKLSYDPKLREEAMKGPNGYLVYPEMDRNAILYGGTDPGRFCPTYMIFCDSFIPHDQQPKDDQHFDRRDVYIITQNALADGTYMEYVRAQYNRSTQKDPPFFQELLRTESERTNNINNHTNFIARLAYQMFDRPLTAFGARVEARRRSEGVYPPKEIYIPSPEEAERGATEYRSDAVRRLEHDMHFPNEPKQVSPNEGIHVEHGQVGFAGIGYVMAINGVLTKMIFDHNPGNEFYVEESYPMEWMYRHLTPYGVIMKVNRQEVPTLTDEVIKRDHEFWSKYMERLIGNWITYDTPLKDIVDFAEKVYLQPNSFPNFQGFKGDRKFLRDEDAQKYFSHFRGCIANSIYKWRCFNTQDAVERQKMLKEADFAFRQSFALAPFSPEVVYQYVGFLGQVGRLDDALLVATTCAKLDPNNGQMDALVKNIKAVKQQSQAPAPQAQGASQIQSELSTLEKAAEDNPDNVQILYQLAGAYAQLQQKGKAIGVLDRILENPKADANALKVLIQGYAQLGDIAKLEEALQKLVKLEPDSPEAWENLAGIEAVAGKPGEAMKALHRCVEVNSKRLAQDPKSRDMLPLIKGDARFANLRQLTEFQQLIGGASK